MILGGIFITNAVVAELIGVKIFSLEQSLHLAPANIHLFGDFILDFNLTAGVIIWPVVFITTDIINEYFGKKGVQQITFLTVGLIIYVFLVIWVVTSLSPANFWLDINQTDNNGNNVDAEQETMLLLQNQLRYDLLTRSISNQFNQLNIVLR